MHLRAQKQIKIPDWQLNDYIIPFENCDKIRITPHSIRSVEFFFNNASFILCCQKIVETQFLPLYVSSPYQKMIPVSPIYKFGTKQTLRSDWSLVLADTLSWNFGISFWSETGIPVE